VKTNLPIIAAVIEAEASKLPVQSKAKADTNWQEVAGRLERLRAQGESWTNYREMANRFDCSTQLVHKAVHSSAGLTAWARPQQTVIPKAQSLNSVVTDRTAQRREQDPADDAAVREFIEQADPETKSWFHALSSDDQLDVVNDPDKHRKILGRKP
jgi:hypothetical protein